MMIQCGRCGGNVAQLFKTKFGSFCGSCALTTDVEMSEGKIKRVSPELQWHCPECNRWQTVITASGQVYTGHICMSGKRTRYQKPPNEDFHRRGTFGVDPGTVFDDRIWRR